MLNDNDERYLAFEKRVVAGADTLFRQDNLPDDLEVYRDLCLGIRILARDAWVALGNDSPGFGFSEPRNVKNSIT